MPHVFITLKREFSSILWQHCFCSFQGLCRELTCPLGQAPFLGSCKPFASEVNGLCVRVAVQLQIITNLVDIADVNTTKLLGRIIIQRLLKQTLLTRLACDVSEVYLYSSVQQSLGPDLVFWISLHTTPDCQFRFIANQIMAIVGKKMIIFSESGDSLVILPTLDERPLSEILNLSTIAHFRFSGNICRLPYRLQRNNVCPRITLDYTEALEVIGTARKIKFEPLIYILGSMNKTASVEICLEDYNFLMKKGSVSSGRFACYELIVASMLIARMINTFQ